VQANSRLRRVYAELAEDTDAPALDELDELLLHESEAESESDEEELEGLEIDDGAEKPDQAPRDVDAQLAAMEANLAALNEKVSYQTRNGS
jgi:phage shock protein A